VTAELVVIADSLDLLSSRRRGDDVHMEELAPASNMRVASGRCADAL